MTRVNISLSNDLLERLDYYKTKIKLNRSAFIAKAVEYFRDANVDAVSTKMVASEVYRKSFLRNGFIPRFRSKGRFIAYNASKEISDEFLKNPENWFIQQGDLPGIY